MSKISMNKDTQIMLLVYIIIAIVGIFAIYIALSVANQANEDFRREYEFGETLKGLLK